MLLSHRNIASFLDKVWNALDDVSRIEKGEKNHRSFAPWAMSIENFSFFFQFQS